jgi:microcystin-dependent protein
MSEPFLGEIRMFGFNFAPTGWAFCNGNLLPINQNTALFSLLGTFYGGDGRTTFALPNLQGRVPIHQGQGTGSSYVIGQPGGTEIETLSVAQLPAHTHSVLAHKGPGKNSVPTNNVPAGTSGNSYDATGNVNMNASMIGQTGGGEPLSVVQPYLTVNFCIALQGIFPSRS